jgi:ribonucleotide reductase alpha subunit
MDLLVQERVETGRIYIMNIDNANDHSAFTDAIRMSNLCTEINLPTSPLQHIDDGKPVKRKIKVKKEHLDEYLRIKKEDGGVYLDMS